MIEYHLNPFSLSKEINLSNSAVRLLIIGKSKVTVTTALRLAKFFGQTPAYWLELQREADLNEASKGKELQDILKVIPRQRNLPFRNMEPLKSPEKNTSSFEQKTIIITAARTRKSKGPKKVVKKK